MEQKDRPLLDKAGLTDSLVRQLKAEEISLTYGELKGDASDVSGTVMLEDKAGHPIITLATVYRPHDGPVWYVEALAADDALDFLARGDTIEEALSELRQDIIEGAGGERE